MILDGRCLTMYEKVKAECISKEKPPYILHVELSVRKVGTAFVECWSKANENLNFSEMFGPL